MKIYGSVASPFVRKLRILFSEKLPDKKIEFIPMNIYETDREVLKKLSPVLKIPVIEEKGETLYDSRVIFNDFVSQGKHPKLSWQRENLLTIIDGCLDSLINRVLLKRSLIELDAHSVLGRGHSERLGLSFDYLEKSTDEGLFKNWDYVSISLFCLLDWAQFREIYNFEKFPKLLEFHSAASDRPSAKETDPRN